MTKALFTAIAAALCVLVTCAVEAGTKVNGTANLGGSKSVTWYLPSGTPSAWVYLQHGFFRNRSNMDDLATAYMDAGLMVLTVDNNVSGGGSSNATKAANALVDAPPTPPSGYALPNKLILSGHSAGGLHVTYMAGQLVTRNYAKLAGLILLDPVDDSNAMLSRMQSAINKGAKVYAYLARPGSCNKNNNALTPLRSLTASFVGVQAIDGSTHNDAEGASGGVGLCGSSNVFNIDLLQEFATAWAADIAAGATTSGYYPNGARLSGLITASDMKLIKPYTAPVCGNGVIEASEGCDGGVCCDASCQLRASTYVCRAATNACDVAESCSGAASTCPADVLVANATTCATGKQCWNGQCMPAPVCGNGTLENGEQCDGGGCCTTDCKIKALGVSCRAAADGCDLADVCDGSTSTCPSDAKQPDATVCATGICQAGLCSAIPLGWSTALSQTGLSGSTGNLKYFQFQAPVGVTDVQVLTSGGTGNADLYVKKNTQVSTTVYDCRPYKTNNTETCNLSGPGIYYILLKSTSTYASLNLQGRYNYPGSVCGNNIKETGEACDGGACCKVDCSFAASATVCRSSNGTCDLAESCTGASGDCPADVFVANTVTCRASAGTCDVADKCTGSAAACPANAFVANGTTCATGRTCQAGSCVTAALCGNAKLETGEVCDGGACCNANCTFKVSGTSCRAATDACDAIESCTGASEVCPIDAELADGAACGANMTCQSGECTSTPPPPPAGWIVEVNQTALSGAVNQTVYYTFTVPSGGTNVSVELTYAPGSGDADLFVKKNASVSTAAYDCRPYKGAKVAETCTFTGPGTYNIMVRGYSAYTGVNLVGKWYRP